MLATRNSLTHTDIDKLKVREWKKIHYANTNPLQKKAELVILISDNIDFRTKRNTEDKEE